MVKYFVILALCLIGASLTRAEFNKEEAIKKVMEAAELCKGTTGATSDDVKELLDKAPASTEAGKCLRSCIMKHFGFLDADGKFVKSVALEHVRKLKDGDVEKIKVGDEIVEICGALELESDHCAAATQLEKCFREQAAAHGIEKITL